MNNNRRFIILVVLLGMLICGSILAYFSFITPAPAISPLALTLKPAAPVQVAPQTPPPQEPQPATPQEPPPARPREQQPSTPRESPPATPRKLETAAPPVEFEKTQIKDMAPTADFNSRELAPKNLLSTTKLDPEMFVFNTLPYDAPLAQFPLVLVWQKNLEWYKTVGGRTAGSIAPPSGNIYGRPPSRPPTPPNPPPNPPPKPPPEPPKPPPEVSTSGL